ncbi:protein cordon-bleu isoform X4 [Pygocentrus nattereri]|uniref:WH2 domain-containing protein n=2 Tax=Pygocentrus nattereri TaxID=42514 RepID=A0A3B4DUN5_PYGNA|nr:protein cordon-bleu isoform X4 [Pygocentrus nattereri]
MDLGTSARPPVGRRMKAKAPPPPPAPQPAPRKIFRNAVPDGGGSPGGDTKENMLRTTVDLHITLPAGYQTTVTVNGRKALMDLLVDLCSQYHLNPAYHTLELLSPEAQSVAFKPNALLGALDVSCALIKERVAEERVVRKPPPKVPEKTVRLVVNFHRGQKAVVRVNPLVPLQSLVPVICQKCEFDPAHVLLLQDSVSNHELDLRKSLSDLDIRELYVLDQTLAESLHSNTQSASGVEKKGLLGFFKISRRKSKTEELSSEDMDDLDDSVMQNTDTYENGLSVAGGPCVEVRPNTLGQSQSAMNLSRLSPKTEPKKRRAPAPPPPPAHTHTAVPASLTKPGSPRLDSQMKKRKAPAPPPTPTPSTPEQVLTVPVAVVHVPPQAQGRTSVPVQVLSSTSQADDSLSDLSHSIEDSEPAGSICSSSSSDAAAESASSSLAEELMPEPTNKRPASSTPEPEPELEANPQPAPRITVKQEPGPSSTPEESALELKMEEMENNRHSAIGSGCNVPLKPRRSPLRELKQLTVSSPPSSPPPPSGQDLQQQTSIDMHISETAPHSWLHSVTQRAEQEVETVSMCSSESLADQGYAASDGMADDSGLLSSPSDLTQPTSPEDIISLNHDPSPSPSRQPKDCSSDSDEGCATWGSRHSEEVHRGNQSEKRQNSYEEDAEITAQIHLTLADLDADLAGEVNHGDEGSAYMDDKIPVSVIDMDVPVTTIDEVPDDKRSSPSVPQAFCNTQSMNKQDITGSSIKTNVNVQNKSNNACLSDKASISQTQADQIQSTEKVVRHDVKGELHKLNDLNGSVPQRSRSPVVCPVVQNVQFVPESRLRPPPLVRSYSMENPEMERALPSKAPTAAQIKITQSPVSRFGLKTFTVIPAKPAVSHTPKPAGSLGTGAIKIDELGNMVKQREARPSSAQDNYSHPNEVAVDPDSPLLGKAKAFWSSAEKQDPAPEANKGTSVTSREAEVPRPLPVTVKSHTPEKSNVEEPLKEASGSTNHSESAVVNKLPISNPTENSSFSEQRKNLFFLKPSRRTSSQYVASAIAKYTGTPTTQVNGIQEMAESTSGGQRQFASRSFKHEIRSYASSNASTSPVPYFPGPKRSQSYPSHIADGEASSDEPRSSAPSKGTLPFGTVNDKSLDSSLVNAKPQQQTQASTYSESTQFSFKEYMSVKSTPESLSPPSTTRPPVPKKPEVLSPGVLPEPNQVTLFGPIKKYKPVILKSVEKEMSLHSSLMEAIQSGEGIERLRKVSGSSLTSTMKKPSYVETENERSALLSAIRAQSNSARLKKTRSEAALELEQFKKAEEDRAAQRDDPSSTPPDPPAFVPPPPPVFVPPPPPPSAPSKPALVLPAGGNPELAREAMLEAIRSGAGAERLRKVPVTVKTRKVNGRLGIIKAPSSPSQEH